MRTAHTPGLSAPIYYFKGSLTVAILVTTLVVTRPVWADEASSSPSPGPTGQSSSGTEVSGTDGTPSNPPTTTKTSSQVPIPAQTEPPIPESSRSGSSDSDTEAGKIIKKKVVKIEVGDKVTVKIYPEDQYIKGGTMDVSSEGTITLPLLGRVTVQGLTVLQAEQKITEVLAKDYLVNPVVVVEVAERVVEKKEQEKKSLSILGQVQKPGSYDFPPAGKMTLLELISKAGGFTDVANAKNIKIIRKKSGKTNAIRANAEAIIAGKDPDVDLQADDVIHVGESFF